VRPPPPDHDALDGAAAARARLLLPPEDPQVLLVPSFPAIHFAIGPVKGRALVGQCLTQHLTDGLVEPLDFFTRQGIRFALGVDARHEEGLVSVDVADASDELLVEQQRLEGSPALPDESRKLGEGKILGQGFRPQTAHHLVLVSDQVDPPEFAHVKKAQLPSVVQVKDGVTIFVGRSVAGPDRQLSGHLEVDEKTVASGQVEDEILAPPPYVKYLPTSDAPLEFGHGGLGDNVLPPDADPGKGAADERPAQAVDDGFDFG